PHRGEQGDTNTRWGLIGTLLLDVDTRERSLTQQRPRRVQGLPDLAGLARTERRARWALGQRPVVLLLGVERLVARRQVGLSGLLGLKEVVTFGIHGARIGHRSWESAMR